MNMYTSIQIPLYLFQNLPPKSRVIRIMPNTPALVQEGASFVAMGTAARPEDNGLVIELMRTVGLCESGPEKLLDAVTGLSGSGPAYVSFPLRKLARPF